MDKYLDLYLIQYLLMLASLEEIRHGRYDSAGDLLSKGIALGEKSTDEDRAVLRRRCAALMQVFLDNEEEGC